jgi:hypothetical protein
MIRSLRRRVAPRGRRRIAQPAPVAAQGDTSAVAINTHDRAALFRLAFQIRQVTADVVDRTTAAVAYSSCEAYRTVAISI